MIHTFGDVMYRGQSGGRRWRGKGGSHIRWRGGGGGRSCEDIVRRELFRRRGRRQHGILRRRQPAIRVRPGVRNHCRSHCCDRGVIDCSFITFIRALRPRESSVVRELRVMYGCHGCHGCHGYPEIGNLLIAYVDCELEISLKLVADLSKMARFLEIPLDWQKPDIHQTLVWICFLTAADAWLTGYNIPSKNNFPLSSFRSSETPDSRYTLDSLTEKEWGKKPVGPLLSKKLSIKDIVWPQVKGRDEGNSAG